MKKIQALEDVAIKCNLVIPNSIYKLQLASKKFRHLKLIWKFYHKQEEIEQLFQQVLLNLDIKCKS